VAMTLPKKAAWSRLQSWISALRRGRRDIRCKAYYYRVVAKLELLFAVLVDGRIGCHFTARDEVTF
jgi:hypothetical protein